jgi:hypothetical protein
VVQLRRPPWRFQEARLFFGVYANISPVALLAALPVAAFEFSLGVYLIVKGLTPLPILAGPIPAIDRNPNSPLRATRDSPTPTQTRRRT